jgi:prepilin-type processing-associated H-X9-DG protein
MQDRLNAKLKNGVRLDKTSNHSKLLLVGDKGWFNQWLPGVVRGVSWHDEPYHYNMVFMDGHVEFVNIRKGLLVTGDYTVLPFRDLYKLAHSFQVEEILP